MYFKLPVLLGFKLTTSWYNISLLSLPLLKASYPFFFFVRWNIKALNIISLWRGHLINVELVFYLGRQCRKIRSADGHFSPDSRPGRELGQFSGSQGWGSADWSPDSESWRLWSLLHQQVLLRLFFSGTSSSLLVRREALLNLGGRVCFKNIPLVIK